MVRIGGTNFDLDYCSHFTAAQLRNIYNGESKETLDLLIAAVHPVEPTVIVEPTKKTKKENS
jgi:hypothetical protein